MRFCRLAKPLSQPRGSTVEESRICRFLRAAVSPLLLLCVFSLLSSPGIAQARAGTAGVTAIKDAQGNVVTPPFTSGMEYTVEWSSTEDVKDIHLPLPPNILVDFDNKIQGNQTIEIDTQGWTNSNQGGGKWINLVGGTARSGKFKITINNGVLVLPLHRPIFTRDGGNWPSNVKDIVPDAATALPIPYVAGTAPTLDVTGLVAGLVATLDVVYATPGGQVRHGYSLSGGGPTGTPFGDLLLSPPFTELPPLHANQLGYAFMTVPVPAGTAGLQVWFHALDLGSLTFTNGVAAVVQ